MYEGEPLWVYRPSPVKVLGIGLVVAVTWLAVLFVHTGPRERAYAGLGIAVLASVMWLRLLFMTVVVFPEHLIVRNFKATHRIRRRAIAGFAIVPSRDVGTGRETPSPTLQIVTRRRTTVEVTVLWASVFGPGRSRDRLKAQAARLERWRVGAEPPPAAAGTPTSRYSARTEPVLARRRNRGAAVPYGDGVTKSQHAGVLRVTDALAAAGATGEVVELSAEVRTAALAAEALGVEVGAIANSLVFDADGEPLLVLTSGAHRVATTKVAELLGVRALRRATPDFVRSSTGQVIGGVAPVGHPAPLRTLVDVVLADYDVVWASGGVPHVVFATTYDELVRITGGTPAEVG